MPELLFETGAVLQKAVCTAPTASLAEVARLLHAGAVCVWVQSATALVGIIQACDLIAGLARGETNTTAADVMRPLPTTLTLAKLAQPERLAACLASDPGDCWPVLDARGQLAGTLERTSPATGAAALPVLNAAYFAAMFGNSDLAIAQVNPDGRFKHVNTALCQLLGYPPEQLLQQSLTDLIGDPVCLPEWLSPEPKQLCREVRCQTAFDERIWIELSAAPLYQASQQLAGWLLFFIDISTRKSLEQKILSSEAWMRSCFEAISDLILIVDADCNTLAIPPTQAALSADSADNLVEATTREILYGERAAECRACVRRVLASGQPASLEYALKVQGRQAWFSANIAPLNETEAIWVARDVSERQQAEQALRAAKEAAEVANVAKSQFLAATSHELRTPLNAILGFSQLLSDDPRLDRQQRDYLSIIESSGEHLLEIINDILDLSKIEAGKVNFEQATFNLHQLLEMLREMFALKAQSKGVNLVCDYDPLIPQFVRGDASKLRQVLINLLGNAVKFTPQGCVRLQVIPWSKALNVPPLPALKCPETALVFTVDDTGPGIAPKELAAIFDAFTQSQSGRESMQGTGLGLTISRRFIQLMGGDIWVRSHGHLLWPQPDGSLASQPEGETPLAAGACFSFAIPLEPAGAPEAIAPASPRSVLSLAPGQPTYRIAIAEDVENNRRLLRDLLQPLGFAVREAADGAAIVELWRTWQPQAIFMDMQMPVLDGYAATREIRRLASNNAPAPAIIAITAAALDDQREAILAAGCDDVICKPLLRDTVLEKLADHLGARCCYQSSAPAEPPPSTRRPKTSSRELAIALQVMPQAWLAQLRHAALSADEERMCQLIGQIPAANVNLASTLTDLVLNFEIEQIIQALALAFSDGA